MIDIVDWLRKEAELIALPRLKEAAGEIERLRTSNVELMAALRIAHMALELRGPGFPLDEISAAIAKAVERPK